METITDIQGVFTLHNGVKMPYFGLGVYLSQDGQEVINAIQWAVEAGYRHIDTASIYNNERGVGEGVRRCGLTRDSLFVVSKVWNTDQGYDTTLRAFDASMERLGMDYLDLYLVHWPKAGKYKDTWRALERIYKEGRVRSIGVSNFMQHHLEDLLSEAEVVPMVNQMEFHPYLVQQSLLDYCRDKQIQYEAWSPLMQGHIFEVPLMQTLAEKYQKTIPQVVLRYDLQKGVITIPKSSKKERIISNADIFDFEISVSDMNAMDALDQGRRFGPDPDNFDF